MKKFEKVEKTVFFRANTQNTSDWLYAIPIPSLGLHLDPMAVHIACGLRLGTTLCHPHEYNCGEMVESNGRHGLKCKQAHGRKTRHEEVNKLLKLGLDQAKSPSTLEPIGLSRKGDRRRLVRAANSKLHGTKILELSKPSRVQT